MAELVPTTRQRRLLERYLDELGLFNQRLNLTTVPRQGAWERHVVESLDLLATARLAAGCRVADLGSGGGVPGVVVAVMRPDVAMTLVEADRRKAGFLVHVAGLLELENVVVEDRRAEAMARDVDHSGRYDAALSRAAAPPPQLVRLAMPLLRPGARLWALVADAATSAAEVNTEGCRAWAGAPGILVAERAAEPGVAEPPG